MIVQIFIVRFPILPAAFRVDLTMTFVFDAWEKSTVLVLCRKVSGCSLFGKIELVTYKLLVLFP